MRHFAICILIRKALARLAYGRSGRCTRVTNNRLIGLQAPSWEKKANPYFLDVGE